MDNKNNSKVNNMETIGNNNIAVQAQKFFIGVAIGLTVLWAVMALKIVFKGFGLMTTENAIIALGVLGFGLVYARLAK